MLTECSERPVPKSFLSDRNPQDHAPDQPRIRPSEVWEWKSFGLTGCNDCVGLSVPKYSKEYVARRRDSGEAKATARRTGIA